MTETLRILIVDDEPLAISRLELLIGRIPGTELIGKAFDAREALELVGELRPDVLLLDIKMAGGSGFDVVDKLTGPFVPQVVFVTAFDNLSSLQRYKNGMIARAEKNTGRSRSHNKLSPPIPIQTFNTA